MASNDFQLRAYVFLDSLQPQLAQYMAKREGPHRNDELVASNFSQRVTKKF